MFSKIKAEIKNYATSYDGLRKVFEDEQRKIFDNYKGSFRDDEYARAKSNYDESLISLKAKFNETIDTIFEQLTEKVRQTVVTDMSPEVMAELSLIKDMKLSEFELKGYAEKYAGNHRALQILRGIAEKNGKTFIYTTHDDIMATLKELREKIRNFKDCYQGNFAEFLKKHGNGYDGDYECEIMLNGYPIDTAEDKYADFMNPFKGVA